MDSMTEWLGSVLKCITDAGAAAVLREKVDLLELQRDSAEARAKTFATEVAQLRQVVEALQSENDFLRGSSIEDERTHRGILFKKGRKTGGKWVGICPKCGLPVNDVVMASGEGWVLCSTHCGWVGVHLRRGENLSHVCAELTGSQD